ncbi:MAG TPA: class I tRNA ligase family protein, partial [Candidatus Anoxymicrobiaceae bacterium]
YTYPADSRGRRSAQTAIFEINSKLTAMMAPVLAHTAEEAMLALPEGSRPAESIHMALWPTYDESRVDEALEVKWDRLLVVREDVYRKIEESRKQGLVGTSLEAKAVIYAAGETMGLLRGMEEQLPAVLITSAVEIRDLDSFAGVRELTGDVEVEVQRAQGGKCQRCWNYSSSVSADSEEPGVCDRCEAALGSMGR